MDRDEAWSFYEAGWLDAIRGYGASSIQDPRPGILQYRQGWQDGKAYRKTLRAIFDATWDAAEKQRERDDG